MKIRFPHVAQAERFLFKRRFLKCGKAFVNKDGVRIRVVKQQVSRKKQFILEVEG